VSTDREKRPFMQIEQIVRKQTYSGILLLLATFHTQSKIRGLQQKHFRYVLLKKPDLDQLTMKKMKKFFHKKPYLPMFKGSINSKYHLDKCLKQLLKWGYIKSSGKKGKKYYTLTKKFFADSSKFILIRAIEKSQNVIIEKEEPNYTFYKITSDRKGKYALMWIKCKDNYINLLKG